jgi:hypothetical protein
LALSRLSFDTASESVGYYHSSASPTFEARLTANSLLLKGLLSYTLPEEIQFALFNF